mmetsp:Transcript_122950/g.244619  ORF Transcript_122950/g.244619 Transcript_122950/m.244619 type:complete len:431 (-) Transcript_122950:177-1469(-)|eukprot:CAMPEP_0172722506 /NCGR_PEP_ID=MMETSP1074-20121228/81650_1 /TAXON_ID=2916 /ORGANISM="Ceratium fusus, Strain PA161109" /LENGTH=430 /DNA_ID=CAMNT_0013548533 /DNA_START=92 /DNA_END=1384 /DNA_ORIENTATION=-
MATGLWVAGVMCSAVHAAPLLGSDLLPHFAPWMEPLTTSTKNNGPVLAPSWTASVNLTYSSGKLASSQGKWSYDGPRQRWRLSTCMNETIFRTAGDSICNDQLAVNATQRNGLQVNLTVGQGAGQVCKAYRQPYYDFFALLAHSERIGNSSVGGEPCDIWAISFSSVNFTLSACVAADGVPRQLNVSNGAVSYKLLNQMIYTLSDPHIGHISDDAFAPSDACAFRYPQPACTTVAKQVVPLTVYRVHDQKEPLYLENRNTGDALGDMAFFCDVAGLDATQFVTKWSVAANASWGQYGYCLFSGGKNMCYGNTGKQVGRESALGASSHVAQGQCSQNLVTGSWYTFPDEGRCLPGTAVGTHGCTWSAMRVRTVHASCIIQDHGLKASCAAERGHAPMKTSAAIFEAALATSDITKGGCPDVDVSDGNILLV